MQRDDYRLIYRNFRRSFEKRFGGYLSEAFLNINYIFREKREPSIKFIIFSYQRTGSTLLVDLLNSHPRIECVGELLLNRMFFPSRFLKLRAKLSKEDVFGFKMLTPHFDYQGIADPERFTRNLFDSGYKIIKLKRKNVLRTAISLIYAINSGKFHFQQSSIKRGAPKIFIEPQDLIDKIKWIEHNISVQEQVLTDIPYLEVVYEDDLIDASNHKDTINRIADFLGVQHGPIHTKLVKYTDDLSQIITNADEVKAFIHKTGYSNFLDFR